MMKLTSKAAILILALTLFMSGCGTRSNSGDSTIKGSTTQNTVQKDSTNKTDPAKQNDSNNQQPIDLAKVQPNESGTIMVVMFHNFIEEYKSGDKDYTNTFDAFEKLLQALYDKDYRLISLNDYLNNNINVPAGYIPMVFTFDDGTAGQFNLVEENGRLVANKKSAVGIMEEFNKTHPDFGLKGTFFVNLGGPTFTGKGTVEERLKYLIDEGFEIGNHTLNHIDFKGVTTADKVLKEVGGNQKAMLSLIPGYMFKALALPLGHKPKSDDLKALVEKGEFEGVKYENFALMEVGANPAESPVSLKYNPISTARVRASGIQEANMDLNWWLAKLTRKTQYVSDGNPDTITVPKDKEAKIDKNKLNGKKLIVY